MRLYPDFGPTVNAQVCMHIHSTILGTLPLGVSRQLLCVIMSISIRSCWKPATSSSSSSHRYAPRYSVAECPLISICPQFWLWLGVCLCVCVLALALAWCLSKQPSICSIYSHYLARLALLTSIIPLCLLSLICQGREGSPPSARTHNVCRLLLACFLGIRNALNSATKSMYFSVSATLDWPARAGTQARGARAGINS